MTLDGDLAAKVQQLLDIEAIKQLKARYFRLIDTKDWAAFRDVFTADCKHFYVSETGEESYSTNEQYFPMMESFLSNGITTHHGHTPEISFASDTEASAIWAMFDYVQCVMPHGRSSLMGYGHYYETYRREADGEWRMSSKRNVRLRVDEVPWTVPD
jgi:hypothetical protein